MSDPLAEFIKPGYPKESVSGAGYSTIIEYIGPKESLYGVVNLGESWGEYRGKVEDVQGDPVEGQTGYATLLVRMLAKFGDDTQPADIQGTEEETIYEIEWLGVQKPLIEHPVFQTGGASALSNTDKAEIKLWEQMPIPDFKVAYLFYVGDISQVDAATLTSGDLETLSANAQVYANGRLKDIEYFNAKTPILRKSTTYKNGIPPQGAGVGEKETPPDFPNVPDGYEYIKEADRSTNTGKQNEWRRDQEWLGADKVLIDSKNIYY